MTKILSQIRERGVLYPSAKTRSDSFRIPVPAGEVFHSCRLTILDARLGGNAMITSQPVAGAVGENEDLILFIYDPNWHDRDNMTLKLSVGDPEHKTEVVYSDSRTVKCFFQTNYTFSLPPSNQAPPGRIILFEDEDFGGKSINVVRAQADLTIFKEGNFNDRTSSLTILSGNWSFYRDPLYRTPFMHGSAPLVLGPGSYRRIADLGIEDDSVSSLREVSGPANC